MRQSTVITWVQIPQRFLSELVRNCTWLFFPLLAGPTSTKLLPLMLFSYFANFSLRTTMSGSLFCQLMLSIKISKSPSALGTCLQSVVGSTHFPPRVFTIEYNARWRQRNHSLFSTWTGLNSRYAITTLISSRPNFKQGRSPIFEAFFLLRLFYYQRALHSFTKALAAVSRSQCCSTKPQTSAELITSQQPSEPITMKRSVSYSYRFWISGQEMSPMRLAYKSPSDRVMAIPGPSQSAQTLGGPTCCPS